MSLFTLRTGATAHPEDSVLQLLTDLIANSGVLSKDTGTTHFAVQAQGTPDMTVKVKTGRAYIKGATGNGYPIISDADTSVAIGSNGSGSTRIDAIVLYIDKSASANSDASNVAKLIAVQGTISAPTDGAIQTAIGAANPFLRLADVSVGSGVTSIVSGNITDQREIARQRDVTDAVSLNEQSATPATPSSGLAKIYAKTDKYPYLLNSDGKEMSLVDGWIPANDALSYASADANALTWTATLAGDKTAKYTPGMRLKATQSRALTSLWNLNANSNDSVGTHNGSDTAITYQAGKISNGALFNGTSSKITFTDHANLKPTGNFTFGGWIKPAGTVDRLIFQSFSQNSNAAGIRFEIDASNINLVVGRNTGTTPNLDYALLQVQLNADGVPDIADGNWHHVGFSWNGQRLCIYIDGIKVAQKAWAYAPGYAATNYVQIGAKNFSGSQSWFYVGMMDDLFLINGYALAEETFRDIYNAGTAMASPMTLNKKFIVTKSAYANPNTTLTLFGGQDYTLENAAITDPYFSIDKSPAGWPGSHDTWMVEYATDLHLNQGSPTASVWYNIGAHLLDIPIGAWDVEYKVSAYGNLGAGAGGNIYTTLSRQNNSESDPDFSSNNEWGGSGGGAFVFINKPLKLGFKTRYYLNTKITTGGTPNGIYNFGERARTLIRAVSAYL